MVAMAISAGAATPVFTEDFSKAERASFPRPDGVGRPVLGEGGAAGRYLELPGAPLESYAAMFGPANKENWSARRGFQPRARDGVFRCSGVSINGVGGYRAQVAPAKKELELLKGDETVAKAPFVWENASDPGPGADSENG
jgi:hypothetical protein